MRSAHLLRQGEPAIVEIDGNNRPRSYQSSCLGDVEPHPASAVHHYRFADAYLGVVQHDTETGRHGAPE